MKKNHDVIFIKTMCVLDFLTEKILKMHAVMIVTQVAQCYCQLHHLIQLVVVMLGSGIKSAMTCCNPHLLL